MSTTRLNINRGDFTIAVFKDDYHLLRHHVLANKCPVIRWVANAFDSFGWITTFRFDGPGVALTSSHDICIIIINFAYLDKLGHSGFRQSFLYHSLARSSRENRVNDQLQKLLEEESQQVEHEKRRRRLLKLDRHWSIHTTTFSALLFDSSDGDPCMFLFGVTIAVEISGSFTVIAPRQAVESTGDVCMDNILTPCSYLELDCIRFTARLATSYLDSANAKEQARWNIYKRGRVEVEEFAEQQSAKRVRVC